MLEVAGRCASLGKVPALGLRGPFPLEAEVRIPRAVWLILFLAAAPRIAAADSRDSHPQRFGVGAQYWMAVEHVDADNVDEDGISWFVSYQTWSDWIGWETALQWYRKGYGGADDDVLGPITYLLVGKGLYGAVGIGGYYSGGVFARDPFYALRVGLDLPFMDWLHADVSVNYRFEDWDDLSDGDSGVGSDTITLAGALRLAY